MSLFHNDCGCNDVAGAATNRCEGCACDQLRNLSVGTEIEKIIVKGEDITKDLDDIFFISFDRRTCCATFIAENDDKVIFTLDCRKIDTIFFELD